MFILFVFEEEKALCVINEILFQYTEVMSYVIFLGFWVINKYQLFADLNTISICNSQ